MSKKIDTVVTLLSDKTIPFGKTDNFISVSSIVEEIKKINENFKSKYNGRFKIELKWNKDSGCFNLTCKKRFLFLFYRRVLNREVDLASHKGNIFVSFNNFDFCERIIIERLEEKNREKARKVAEKLEKKSYKNLEKIIHGLYS